MQPIARQQPNATCCHHLFLRAVAVFVHVVLVHLFAVNGRISHFGGQAAIGLLKNKGLGCH